MSGLEEEVDFNEVEDEDIYARQGENYGDNHNDGKSLNNNQSDPSKFRKDRSLDVVVDGIVLNVLFVSRFGLFPEYQDNPVTVEDIRELFETFGKTTCITLRF